MAFATGEAQAKRRGFTLITTGSTHSELGAVKASAVAELSDAERMEIEQRHYDTVGYQYSHFGIFWLDIWNWSGEYIVYNKVSEDGGVTTPEVAAALLGVPPGKAGKPLNYRMPYGLMVVLGLVSLKVVPRLLMARRRKQQQSVPDFTPPPDQPRWTPPPAGGPPPMPPPLPPEQ